MIEIKDVELALAKENRVSALTMLRQVPLQAEQEVYRQQTEMYITHNELGIAKRCLEIMQIKESHKKIQEADQQPLAAATAMLEATTTSFTAGQCSEEDLDKATDYLYTCLTDMVKEERGIL